jgi:hypothetical protein
MSSPLGRSWLAALFAVISFQAPCETAPANPTASEWLFEEMTFESKGVSLAGFAATGEFSVPGRVVV